MVIKISQLQRIKYEDFSSSPLLNTIFILYCCITNHHKFRGLKQCLFIISQFRRPEVRAGLIQVLCIGSHKAGVMGAAELGSHLMEKTLAASLLGSLTDGVPVLVGLKFRFLWLSMEASLSSWQATTFLLLWPLHLTSAVVPWVLLLWIWLMLPAWENPAFKGLTQISWTWLWVIVMASTHTQRGRTASTVPEGHLQNCG